MRAVARLKFWTAPSEDLLLPLRAIVMCFINILDLAPLIVEAGLLAGFAICMIRRGGWKRSFLRSWPYLAVAAAPLVWLAIAARPAYHHFYFQYRILGILLFGGLLFMIRMAGWDAPGREEASGSPALSESEPL